MQSSAIEILSWMAIDIADGLISNCFSFLPSTQVYAVDKVAHTYMKRTPGAHFGYMSRATISSPSQADFEDDIGEQRLQLAQPVNAYSIYMYKLSSYIAYR